jgi:hypothetical protein
VNGDRLARRQVLSSGGTFPVSVAVHGDLVYVLNALGGGRLQGYRVTLVIAEAGPNALATFALARSAARGSWLSERSRIPGQPAATLTRAKAGSSRFSEACFF